MSDDDVKRLLAEATPGPWRVAGRMWMVVSESDRLLCDCIGDTDMGLREASSNARLIAAAPTIAAAYIEQAATIARLTEERDRLREALELLVRDVADYEAWQRPCLALDRARAALAAMGGGEMSGWRPISTAPRDGSWIITFSPDAAAHDIRPVRMNTWHNGGWWCTNATHWPPTHWQPLPKPPEGE